MFDKKQLIKLFGTLIGGLALVGIMLGVLSSSNSGSVEFESNSSEVTYDSSSTDASDDFDADFDSDFDSDSDFDDDFDDGFGDDSDDFDVSSNYYPEIDPDFIGPIDLEEYKNAFDLRFDLTDAERDIRKNHSEDRYRLKDIIIETNDPTDTGYNATVQMYFEGYDTVLRQGVCLSYDLDETFNKWDYKGYELVGSEKIYSSSGDNEYFEVERANVPSTKTGTFVYEAINRATSKGNRFRRLYVYYVAPGTAMDYEISSACMTLFDRRVYSFDYINKTGEVSVRPKEAVKYDIFTNGLLRESESIPVFQYNEYGGMADDRPYVRISDDILSQEAIAEKWVK